MASVMMPAQCLTVVASFLALEPASYAEEGLVKSQESSLLNIESSKIPFWRVEWEDSFPPQLVSKVLKQHKADMHKFIIIAVVLGS